MGKTAKTDIMGMGLQDTPASIDMKSTDTERQDGIASQPAASSNGSKRRRRGGQQQYCVQPFSSLLDGVHGVQGVLGVREGSGAGVRFSGARGGG